MIIAGIGTREPNPTQSQAMIKLGAWLVREGHSLRSGNALGSDQLFAQGANSVNPFKVTLCLPWRKYEEQAIVAGNEVISIQSLDQPTFERLYKEASHNHPVFDRLSQGAQKLHIRNGLILEGCDLVIACPSQKTGGGGTGQAIRCAQVRGIRVVEVSAYTNEQFFALAEELRRK